MNKELLTNLFSTDKELLNTYHILAPASAEICAERTLKDLTDAKVEVHLIKKNNEVIGYYGIERNFFLTGFFLTPENRSKSMVELFWKKVESHFTSNYAVCLYTKNIRAMNFMNKKTNEKHVVDNDTVLFTVRR